MIILLVFKLVTTQNITSTTTSTPIAFINTPQPTVNPNGFNPVFGDIFVVKNELMAAYNVTYWDLINKPVQGKIFLQSLVEDGQTWYELCVRKSDEWVQRFNDYTDFTKDFEPLTPKVWSLDMILIIEKFEELYRRGMRDLQQILYPWVQYKCITNHITNEKVTCSAVDVEKNLIAPYFTTPIKQVCLWFGDFGYRLYDMIFGRYGWVRVGQDWMAEWKQGFKYHRVSQVSRGILFMAEDFKVFLASSLKQWEEILCGPMIGSTGQFQSSGTCLFTIGSMPDGPDLSFIVRYFDYVLVFLDKLDEAVEWFSLVIGNIIDASTSNKLMAKTRYKDEL